MFKAELTKEDANKIREAIFQRHGELLNYHHTHFYSREERDECIFNDNMIKLYGKVYRDVNVFNS